MGRRRRRQPVGRQTDPAALCPEGWRSLFPKVPLSMKTGHARVLLSAALPGLWLCAALNSWRAKAAPASTTLLFVDDQHVLYRPGAERVLLPLKRWPGNPVIKCREKPWEIALAWTSVYRDPESGRY